MAKKEKTDEKKTKGEKTREFILECAARCIVEEGIEHASYAQIAEKAGVTRGLVFHYFQSKEALFAEILDSILHKSYDYFRTKGGQGTPLELIRENVTQNMEFWFENGDYFCCFILYMYYAGFRPEYQDVIHKAWMVATDRYKNLLTDHFALIGRPKDNDHAAILGRMIHHIVHTNIQKFYATKHGLSKARYKEQALAELDILLGTLEK